MHGPHTRSPARTALAAFVLLATPLVSGCMDGDEQPALLFSVEPAGEARAFEALLVDVRAEGAPAPGRIGVAWAAAPTRAIAPDMLRVEAFDGIAWAAETGAVQATVRIDQVPNATDLFLRGVAETSAGMQWGDEVRVAITPPPPPILIDVRVTGIPPQAYPREPLSFTLHAEGHNGSVDAAGIAWGSESHIGRDPATLRLGDHEEVLRLDGTPVLPLAHDISDWSTLENESVYLRGWVLHAGTYHWGNEHLIGMIPPPIVDAHATEPDHVVSIEPGIVPLPALAAFTPGTLTLRVGEALRWDNNDAATHTASHDAPEGAAAFHTGSLGAGTASQIFRFLVPGTYEYVCRVHPDTMQATIVVEEE